MSRLKKIIFCGTSEFAVPSLLKLIDSEYKPLLVITQPDKPKGRNRKILPGIVKKTADDYYIECFQPDDINCSSSLDIISETDPDLIITVSYGGFLSKYLRDIPKYGCINLHPSLLPKYRGASPINYALFNGDKITGNTIFALTSMMDAGPILFQQEIKIKSSDNYTTLSKILAETGAESLLYTLDYFDSLKPQKQNKDLISYSKKIEKADTCIDWNMECEIIHNKIRGLSLKPGAVTYLNEKQIKILESEPTLERSKKKPGKINKVLPRSGFTVATLDYDLLILKVQPEGKNVMPTYDFCLGCRNLENKSFTNGHKDK